MISGMRDQVLALACLHHDVPAVQGRGMDDLPAEVTASFAGALLRSLDPAELTRAFAATTEALLSETAQVDADLPDRIAAVLREMAAVTAR
jgi:hypothetical protein